MVFSFLLSALLGDSSSETTVVTCTPTETRVLVVRVTHASHPSLLAAFVLTSGVGRTLPPSPHMSLQDTSLFNWLLVDRRAGWRVMSQLWSAWIAMVEWIVSLKMPVQGLGALIPL